MKIIIIHDYFDDDRIYSPPYITEWVNKFFYNWYIQLENLCKQMIESHTEFGIYVTTMLLNDNSKDNDTNKLFVEKSILI